MSHLAKLLGTIQDQIQNSVHELWISVDDTLIHMRWHDNSHTDHSRFVFSDYL